MVFNETLNGLNKRHDYPKTWMITIPSRTTDEVDKAPARDDVKAPAGGGVKAKVNIRIPDESNGRTSLGHVVCVRKAGYGLRVIVNRGTQENPLFEIYPGSEFGKWVAKEWLTIDAYNTKDLPKDIAAKQMIIFGRVKVKGTKKGRAQNQPQFYLIRVENQEYVTARSTLSKMQGAARLRRIDEQLDTQYLQLRDELDQCRENNEHPDTGKPLTSADIELMPWLSPYGISKPENEKSYGNESENDDIEILIPQRAGLQRSSSVKNEI